MLSLIIMGFDTDPEVVTDVLGLEPTSVRRKGDVNKSGIPSRSNGWFFDIHQGRLTDGEQHEDALASLLSHLQGREANFARLRAEVRPNDVGVWGGIHVPVDGQCGIWLTPDNMMTLAKCGIAWDMHLAVDN